MTRKTNPVLHKMGDTNVMWKTYKITWDMFEHTVVMKKTCIGSIERTRECQDGRSKQPRESGSWPIKLVLILDPGWYTWRTVVALDFLIEALTWCKKLKCYLPQVMADNMADNICGCYLPSGLLLRASVLFFVLYHLQSFLATHDDCSSSSFLNPNC